MPALTAAPLPVMLPEGWKVRFLDDFGLRWTVRLMQIDGGTYRASVTPDFCRMAVMELFYAQLETAALISALEHIDQQNRKLIYARRPDYIVDSHFWKDVRIDEVSPKGLAWLKGTFPESDPRHQAAVAQLARNQANPHPVLFPEEPAAKPRIGARQAAQLVSGGAR